MSTSYSARLAPWRWQVPAYERAGEARVHHGFATRGRQQHAGCRYSDGFALGRSQVSEQRIFVLAEKALADVIDQIRDDQWEQRKPEWFQTGGQGPASLREIINYHAYDSAWVPDVLAGKT